jgi:hypothetical protein
MMDFCITITEFELHDRLRKSEEEKEELRVRLEHSQLTVIRLEHELKARTSVVTRNANTQTMDAKVFDLPPVVPSTKEQSTRDMYSTSKMIFSELKSVIRGALSDDASKESQNTAAGCSDRSSNPPDAESRSYMDHVSEASFKSSDAPPDAESRLYLDITETSFTSSDAPPDAESILCSNDIAQSSIEIQNLNKSLLPDSSLMDNPTSKQRTNQRTNRRKKENKQREAQRKVASSLEESLLPMQNALKPEADFVDLQLIFHFLILLPLKLKKKTPVRIRRSNQNKFPSMISSSFRITLNKLSLKTRSFCGTFCLGMMVVLLAEMGKMLSVCNLSTA